MSEEKSNIPKHIGIIMDGNRRWAKERNLNSFDGHEKGYQKMKEVPKWFFDRGVKTVSFYVFSAENWNRARNEVNYLMQLIKKVLTEEFEDFNKRGYRIVISGRIDELPGDLPEICREVESKTKNNAKGIVNICLNYSGRMEIVDAIRKIIKNKIELEQLHEGMIKKYFYHSDLSDPDVIVRTSGEQRLSGFLLWQSAYSELIFLKKHWPDFEEQDADGVLNEYANRSRRFGE